MPINGYIDTVFAKDGDKVNVPDVAQGDSSVSYDQGYTPLYSEDPNSGGLDIERAKLNQVLFDITSAIQQYQQMATPPFITSVMNGGSPYVYPAYARVLLGGVVYQSLVNSNADTPPSAKWGIVNLNSSAPVHQAKFQYASSTTCTLFPKNGNQVTFPSGTVASIPSAGVSSAYNNAYVNGVAAQALAANTLYYAYLAYISSAWVIDWSTTGYAVDSSTGITIKSGDATRVLVGMAYTNGSGQFTDTATNRYTRSWANDRGVATSSNFSTTRVTTSGTPTELNQEIRNNILLWAGESVNSQISGTGSNNTSGLGVGTGVGVDSTSSISGGGSGSNSNAAGNGVNITCSYIAIGLSEGLHFFTLLGYQSGGGQAQYGSATYLQCITNR